MLYEIIIYSISQNFCLYIQFQFL